jgi:hypothetical protein
MTLMSKEEAAIKLASLESVVAEADPLGDEAFYAAVAQLDEFRESAEYATHFGTY